MDSPLIISFEQVLHFKLELAHIEALIEKGGCKMLCLLPTILNFGNLA
jgi:hypothetical protein